MFDFHIFYQGGKAVLSGYSPYLIDGFISPYPLAIFFVPFALLPEYIAYGVFILINIFLLWKVIGNKIFWSLFSFPVIFCLFVGQVDLLIGLLSVVGPSWILCLALIKPQIGFVIFPWLFYKFNRSEKIKVLCWGILFLIISFILMPNWLIEWMSVGSKSSDYSNHASNFYWLIKSINLQSQISIMIVLSIIVLLLGIIVKKRVYSWCLLQLFMPVSNIYSASILAQWIGPIEFLLSWIAIFLVGGRIHAGAPMLIIGVSIFLRNFLGYKQYKIT